MIPKTTIDQWRKTTNWPLDSQVEQDLVISRALVELFNHNELKNQVAFRGGTALHKLIFPKPLRYSEDIDLNRLQKGGARPVIDGIREALTPMLGAPKKIKSTKNSLKIIYQYASQEGEPRKLKVEVNTRETLPQEPLVSIPYSVESDYFNGTSKIITFTLNEMAGTKIRALYQRKKGRDLFDLFKLDELVDIDWKKAAESFKKLKVNVSSKEFTINLKNKFEDPEFTEDIYPLLPLDVPYDADEAANWFESKIIPLL